jgi:hypothetical protein
MPLDLKLSQSGMPFSHHVRINGSSLQITSLILLLLAFQIVNGVTFVISVASNVPLSALHILQNRIESHILRVIALITESSPSQSLIRLPPTSDAIPTEYNRYGSRYLEPVTPAATMDASSNQLQKRYLLKSPLVKMKQIHGIEAESLRYSLFRKAPVISPGYPIQSQKASARSDNSMITPAVVSLETYHSLHPDSWSGSVYSSKSGGDADMNKKDRFDSSLKASGPDFSHLYNDLLLKGPEFSSISNSPPRQQIAPLRVDFPTTVHPTSSTEPNNSTFPGKFPVSDNLDFSSLATVSQHTCHNAGFKRRPFSAPRVKFLESDYSPELEGREDAAK